ncbi:MAG: HigA family addiction module antidote protein [Saprospiraceae bacterium]|nr:HigA family addiction module antidote protein [Saprospiraceae bacterium]
MLTNHFFPPPGDTLLETIEALGISQTVLAERMNCPLKLVQEIIKGEALITPEIAVQLESILNVPATFWLERERRYRMELKK